MVFQRKSISVTSKLPSTSRMVQVHFKRHPRSRMGNNCCKYYYDANKKRFYSWKGWKNVTHKVIDWCDIYNPNYIK